MRSLLWLAAFSLLSGWLGVFVWFVIQMLGHVTGPISDAPTHSALLDALGLAVLPDVFLLPSVPIITGAAAVVRRWLGRLTGFTLGVIAMLITAAFGMVLMGQSRGVLIGIIGIPKILGAVLLARIPFFRRKALELSPPSRFKGLAGTYAVSLNPDESAALSLGRRAPGERRHTLRRGRRPLRWDSSFCQLAPPPRRVQGRATRTLFFGSGTAWVWTSLIGGALASLASVALYRTPSHSPYESEGPSAYALLIVALVALSLLRSAAIRLHERFWLVRLLRDGEVVQATPRKDALYDQRDAVMTVGETSQGRVLVVSRTPESAGEVQGLLVGKNGDVVAWDLLPFTPVIDETGAITAPYART